MKDKDTKETDAVEIFKDKKDFVREYEENVFKRIENILGAVFYIVSHTSLNNETQMSLSRLNEKAVALHELSFVPYGTSHFGREEAVAQVARAVREVRSVLYLCVAARAVEAAVVQALVGELDVVERQITHHFTIPNFTFRPLAKESVKQPGGVSGATTTATTTPRRQRRAAIPAGDISTDAYLVYSQLNDRAERIKTVLEAKPQATVKDIAEVITDVSEKTIQRELNSLIEKGQVIREGERRWSRYSVAK